MPINDLHGVTASEMKKSEKIQRCKMAATCRLLDLLRYAEISIQNIITCRVEGNDEILVNPHGLGFNEVDASSLIKTDHERLSVHLGSTKFGLNSYMFPMHGSIYHSRPDINCIIGVFQEDVAAISSVDLKALPMTPDFAVLGNVTKQNISKALNHQDDIKRLLKSFGKKSKVILLSRFGALCCGETIEEAFLHARHLVMAAKHQLKLLSLHNGNLSSFSDEVKQACYYEARKEHNDPEENRMIGVGELEFELLMRKLDASGYRTGYQYKIPLYNNLINIYIDDKKTETPSAEEEKSGEANTNASVPDIVNDVQTDDDDTPTNRHLMRNFSTESDREALAVIESRKIDESLYDECESEVLKYEESLASSSSESGSELNSDKTSSGNSSTANLFIEIMSAVQDHNINWRQDSLEYQKDQMSPITEENSPSQALDENEFMPTTKAEPIETSLQQQELLDQEKVIEIIVDVEKENSTDLKNTEQIEELPIDDAVESQIEVPADQEKEIIENTVDVEKENSGDFENAEQIEELPIDDAVESQIAVPADQTEIIENTVDVEKENSPDLENAEQMEELPIDDAVESQIAVPADQEKEIIENTVDVEKENSPDLKNAEQIEELPMDEAVESQIAVPADQTEIIENTVDVEKENSGDFENAEQIEELPIDDAVESQIAVPADQTEIIENTVDVEKENSPDLKNAEQIEELPIDDAVESQIEVPADQTEIIENTVDVEKENSGDFENAEQIEELPIDDAVESQIAVPADQNEIVENTVDVEKENSGDLKNAEQIEELPIDDAVESQIEVPAEQTEIIENTVDVEKENSGDLKNAEQIEELPFDDAVESQIEVPADQNEIIENTEQIEELPIDDTVESQIAVPANQKEIIENTVDVEKENSPDLENAEQIEELPMDEAVESQIAVPANQNEIIENTVDVEKENSPDVKNAEQIEENASTGSIENQIKICSVLREKLKAFRQKGPTPSKSEKVESNEIVTDDWEPDNIDSHESEQKSESDEPDYLNISGASTLICSDSEEEEMTQIPPVRESHEICRCNDLNIPKELSPIERLRVKKIYFDDDYYDKTRFRKEMLTSLDEMDESDEKEVDIDWCNAKIASPFCRRKNNTLYANEVSKYLPEEERMAIMEKICLDAWKKATGSDLEESEDEEPCSIKKELTMTASEGPKNDSGLYTLTESNEIEEQPSQLCSTTSFSLPRVSNHSEGGLRKWGSTNFLNSKGKSKSKNSAESPKKTSVLQKQLKTPGSVRFQLPLQNSKTSTPITIDLCDSNEVSTGSDIYVTASELTVHEDEDIIGDISKLFEENDDQTTTQQKQIIEKKEIVQIIDEDAQLEESLKLAAINAQLNESSTSSVEYEDSSEEDEIMDYLKIDTLKTYGSKITRIEFDETTLVTIKSIDEATRVTLKSIAEEKIRVTRDIATQTESIVIPTDGPKFLCFSNPKEVDEFLEKTEHAFEVVEDMKRLLIVNESSIAFDEVQKKPSTTSQSTQASLNDDEIPKETFSPNRVFRSNKFNGYSVPSVIPPPKHFLPTELSKLGTNLGSNNNLKSYDDSCEMLHDPKNIVCSQCKIPDDSDKENINSGEKEEQDPTLPAASVVQALVSQFGGKGKRESLPQLSVDQH